MPFIETGFQGLWLIAPQVYQDTRGYFFEAYNRRTFLEQGIDVEFVQDNQSRSGYGVVRGLHFQLEPHAQTKLVRVLEGQILDVVVDIRKGSPTFGKTYAAELSSENFLQLYIPKGFAHGFSVLSEIAVVMYKCDRLYHKESEGGIAYNDPALGIDWKIPKGRAVVSEKDLHQPLLKDCTADFKL
jgi:dTDP-4-dehydrorhamnose 3,5-epimerase